MLLNVGILQAIIVLLLIQNINGRTHSIIHPKVFRIDTDETVVINLYGYGRQNVRVDASLTDYPTMNNVFSQIIRDGSSADPISFTMKATSADFPNAATISNKKVEMSIRVRFTNGGHSDINRKIVVYLTGESDYIFVQTNRPIYRPGETVFIRAAPLNSKMLPIRGPNEGFEVTVKTNGVGVWKKVRSFPDNEFISAEYRIPEGPPLGIYSVEVKSTKKTHSSVGSTTFKVDKYVLPTYKVDIEMDQSTVKPNGVLEGKITAKYSYGKPVVGSFALKATLSIPGGEEIDFYKKPQSVGKRPGLLRDSSHGEATFRIAMSLVKRYTNMTWQDIMNARATVSVLVSVMGKAEGIMESAIKEGVLVTNTPYEIDTSLASKYFIPGQIQELMIMVKDVVTGEPVQGVPVTYSANGNPTTAGGPTDDTGFVAIQVEINGSPDSLPVTIRTDDSRLNRDDQAKTIFMLEKHFSNHGYLKMSVDNYNVDVDTTVFVRFNTPTYQPAEIHHVVLSRGTILLSEKRTVNSRQTSAPIRITRKMSPSIRVIGYYMHGNNIVSDSITLNVEEVCTSKELRVSVEPEVVRPGDSVRISYEGERNSMIGTSAVDRAAYFLYNKGRVDRHKMFEKMKMLDMGCSASGGSTPLNVFEEAGLACTTEASSTVPKFELECPQEAAKRRKRSLSDLVGGRTKQERKLIKRCYRDGRLENLADERCQIRSLRIQRLDLPNKILCIRAFLEGCTLGESLRNSSAFRRSTQRSNQDLSDTDSQPSTVKRTQFDEGWLWMTRWLGANGRSSQSTSPPHSITTYDIDAVSVHNTEGFCIAKPAELKVFKDFFTQLYLPYSVKVMEQVQIRAAFFNYHETRAREMNISITVQESLCTQGVPGRETNLGTLVVPPQSSETFIFSIIPLPQSLNGEEAYIELKAKPMSRLDAGAQDIIRRSLNVEAPGNENETSGSFPLDPSSSGQNFQIELNFPDIDMIPDSKKCWIYGFMNYLGPIIEFDPITETPTNLKSSIEMPYGCGEQNMMVMGPNVFAFKYLKHVGDAMPRDQAAVQNHIIAGYTRQQGHRNNGKWSVYSSSSPTIWINAYVNKVFLHAREVWEDMDIRPICDSLDWLATRQSGDGSFSEGSHATYYTINVAQGGEAALTAYVLIALAETNIDCPSGNTNSRTLMMKGRATDYLRRTVSNRNANAYTAAIVAYALALVDVNHYMTQRANRRLMSTRRQEGYESYWQSQSQPGNTIDIETTAYALLTQITIARGQGNRVRYSTKEIINQIANWMVKQQNDRGGFKSSQDTVVAIQSLTEFGKWKHDIEPPVGNPHLDIALTVPGVDWEEGSSFNLDESHEFYRKELEIPSSVIAATRTINVAVRGEGRGRLSYRCIYRSTRNSDKCDFNLEATTARTGHFANDGVSEAAPGEGKEVIKLVINVAKASAGNTGMAIIDINLLSGFKPVISSLETLKVAVDRVIDDYEISGQNVILYVATIRHDEPLRLGFKLLQDVTVLGVSPAKIIVYDYYNPDTSCSKYYTVPDGSPLLRTSCSPSSIDGPANEMCKCSEGGCPTCRKRSDQLLKTCVTPQDCRSCRNCDFNLRNSVCQKNYGFMITILSIDNVTMPQFIKMEARVDKIIHTKSEDTGLMKDQTRVFILRRDCFDKCRDEEAAKTLDKKDYLAVDRTYLARGRAPDMKTNSDREREFDYYLDRDAVLERTLSPDKCARYENREKQCKGNNGARCRKIRAKIRDKLQICYDQEQLGKVVRGGCD